MERVEKKSKPEPKGFCQRVKTVVSKVFKKAAKDKGGQDNIPTRSPERILMDAHWDLAQRRKADTLQELREAQKRTENDLKRIERDNARYE